MPKLLCLSVSLIVSRMLTIQISNVYSTVKLRGRFSHACYRVLHTLINGKSSVIASERKKIRICKQCKGSVRVGGGGREDIYGYNVLSKTGCVLKGK